MKIHVENVRSFAGGHEIPITPLTILVGENSAGKSTFLGMIAAAFNSTFPVPRALFNDPPFDFGGYENIATYKGGRFGRAQKFSIGYSDDLSESPTTYKATYGDKRGQPSLLRYFAKIALDELECSIAEKNVTGTFSIQVGDKKIRTNFQFEDDVDKGPDFATKLFAAIVQETVRGDSNLDSDGTSILINKLFALTRSGGASRTKVIAMAPIRTRPKRTYDELSDAFQPEGDHMPVILSRLVQDRSSEGNRALWTLLNEFGIDSGLFEKVDVKRLGTKESSPFQVRVKAGGPLFNLLDVGYGVSQSLPIVMESLLAKAGQLLLLQQPEVHLHPRAQAALGSLFCVLASSEKKRFVVETHSDYLVDRIRTEVAAGKIKADQVSIIYMERKKQRTATHVLGLDDAGNIIGAPRGYRKFFLDEETRLLSRGG